MQQFLNYSCKHEEEMQVTSAASCFMISAKLCSRSPESGHFCHAKRQRGLNLLPPRVSALLI